MIKHIVIWKLKNKTLPLTECEDALAIKAALEDLQGKIPGLIHIEVGFDYSNKETAGDIVLVSEFDSKEALANYQNHPAHVQVGTIVRPRTHHRRMIDYSIQLFVPTLTGIKVVMKDIYLFDWGDTLMVDFPGIPGKMCDWDYVQATEFAHEVLENISSRAKIYVATAAAESTPVDIKKAFARVGLDMFISGYYCKQNTGYTKPDLKFYKAILEDLAVDPSRVVMVGDTLEKDILPCHELGFNTVWITQKQNADMAASIRVIESLKELCEE